MLLTLYSLALALPAASTAAIDSIVNRAVVGEGFIRYPITVREEPAPAANVARRQDEVPLKNQATGTLYTVKLTIGTPPQPVEVQLDTGSHELWVNPVCSTSNSPDLCEEFGRFTAADSSTYHALDTPGYIPYNIGYVNFTYGNDTVGLGSAKLQNQRFGNAYESNYTPVGIMGVGPPLLSLASPYPLIIDSLKEQNFTNSRAFSLDLRSFDQPQGSIIFGGIDTMKYQGYLEKLPIIHPEVSPDGKNRYWINMNYVAITLPDGTTTKLYEANDGGSNVPVVLDSGTTLTNLPTTLYRAIVDIFPTAKLSTDGWYLVDCALGNSTGSMDFGFGNKLIRVAYKDFIWHDDDLCVLGVREDNSRTILGDTFLRAAYVVYDQDNREIHLAQADNCGSNLVPIGAGVNAVPSIKGGCGEPSTPISSSTPSATATPSRSSAMASSCTSTKKHKGGPTTRGLHWE
jgi:hypothetical protein